MAKVVFRSSEASSTRKSGTANPAAKQKRTLVKRGSKTTLDINAGSFGDDLNAVFEKNVAKARRENKRLVGTPDRVPAKA